MVLMCLGQAGVRKQDGCLQEIREPFAQLHSLPWGHGCSSSKARLELWVQRLWHLVLWLPSLAQNHSQKEPAAQLPVLVLCLGTSSCNLCRVKHLKSN